MCLPKCPETGKSSFQGRQDAMSAALASAPRRAAVCRAHRAYLCPFCRRWHLTRQPYRRDHLRRKARLAQLARLVLHLDRYGDSDD